MAPPTLLSLPAELLNNALSYLEATDLVAFGQTCTHAHKFIRPDNSTLWRHTFLNSYDDPDTLWSTQVPTRRKANQHNADDWDWFSQLRERAINTRIITSQEPIDVNRDLTATVDILLNIVDTAKAKPNAAEIERGDESQVDDRRSLNLKILADLSDRGQRNLDRIIHARQIEVLTNIPARDITNRPVTRSTMQFVEQPDTAARLHVLHGLTKLEKDDARLRGIARRLVYDWSLTGPKTDYGPFKLDGSGAVNWQLLESACTTISRNFIKCADGRYELVSVVDTLVRLGHHA